MTAKLIYAACPECRRPLTSAGCSNTACPKGPGSGYTLPPPPKFTDMPDPFPEVCEKCGQPVPKKAPESG